MKSPEDEDEEVRDKCCEVSCFALVSSKLQYSWILGGLAPATWFP